MRAGIFLGVLLFAGIAVSAQQPAPVPADSNAIKVLFFAGLRDKLNENYSAANDNFQKILAMDPGNAPAYFEIASLNCRQNKLNEAEAAIKKATEINADNIWYWKLFAELYKRKGNMDALVGVFNQMIRLSPDEESFYFDRSNAYLLAGKTEEAMKGYDELEKKFGASASLTQARERVNGEKDEVVGKEEMSSKELAKGNITEQDLLKAGVQLYNQGDLNSALTKFKELLGQNNQLYAAWEWILNIQTRLGLYTEAIKTGEEALSIYPNQGILYYHLAFAFQENNQLDVALKNIQTALQLDVESAAFMERYGDILFLKGETTKALQQWGKAKLAGNVSKLLNRKINEKRYIK